MEETYRKEVSSKMTKIIMHGCNGKMGQVISKLVEEDRIFQKYHGGECLDCNEKPQAQTYESNMNKEVPAYSRGQINESTSGLGYGLGCNKCKVQDVTDDPEGALSLEDLQDMVAGLVAAMKGE